MRVGVTDLFFYQILYFAKKGDIMNSRKNYYKSDSKEGSVDMPTLIREIIEQEEAPYKEYQKYQDDRLNYLRNYNNLSKEEQDTLRKSIIKEFQDMGLIDSSGELTVQYRRGDDE